MDHAGTIATLAPAGLANIESVFPDVQTRSCDNTARPDPRTEPPSRKSMRDRGRALNTIVVVADGVKHQPAA